jgi:hypothetical protein
MISMGLSDDALLHKADGHGGPRILAARSVSGSFGALRIRQRPTGDAAFAKSGCAQKYLS